MFRNTFFRLGVLSPSPNLRAERPPLFGCPRLFVQYIHSYPPYWRHFLHPQPEDTSYRCDRDPLTTEEQNLLIQFTLVLVFKAVSWSRLLLDDLWRMWPRFDPKLFHLRFMVDKVALGQVSLRISRFSLSASFHKRYTMDILHITNKGTYKTSSNKTDNCTSTTLIC
jgi:hypothetical protein